MTTAPTPVEAVEAGGMATAEPLSTTDRCDRCGAQAFVRTEHAAGELLWCKHHYEEHQDHVAPFKTLDERHRLK